MPDVRVRERGLGRLLLPLLALSVVAVGVVSVVPRAAAPAAAQETVAQAPAPATSQPAAAAVEAAAISGPFKILLVGDSITAGQTVRPDLPQVRDQQWPTFRGPLHHVLTQAGRSFDFVGSKSGVGDDRDGQVLTCPPTDPGRVINAFGATVNCQYGTKINPPAPTGPSTNKLYPLRDPHHEGHDGWTVNELTAPLYSWMVNSNADVVVFFGGANDLNPSGSNDAPATVVAEVRQAIRVMQAANPNVRILIPQLPPHRDDKPRTAKIAQYNQLIPAVVNESTATSPVRIVDLFNGYCASGHANTNPSFSGNPGPCNNVQYASDGSHPNKRGGLFIANRIGAAMGANQFFAPRPPRPIGSSGYFLVEQDGDLYAFGSARARLKAIDPGATDNNARGATVSGIVKPRMGGAQAVKVESTADGRGLWVLLSNGKIVNVGTAAAANGVNPASLTKVVAGQPERPAALARLANGDLWVFTSAGRIVPQYGALPAGAQAAMNQVLSVNLVGPILDAKPTRSGTGVYATGSDGGVFAYNAPFHGSVPGALARIGRTTPDQPVAGVTVDPDGTGYWLVAQDGGVFAFAAPFRGSLPPIVPFFALVSPINGIVPFGNGYLLVAGDGGVFNFSNRPFSGSGSGLVDTMVVGITPI